MKQGIEIVSQEQEKIEILFGDHVQKVLMTLKNPNMVFSKDDGSGYFLNYLNYGFDILISEET